MAGERQKSVVQNSRGGRVRSLVTTGRPDGWVPPKLPAEVTSPLNDELQRPHRAKALRHARQVWAEWWSSAPSLAVDLPSDYEAIRWWIVCVFRRALYIQIVIAQPTAEGSMGQVVVNPLEAVIAGLTRDINRVAERFGMDPLSRFRLHFEAIGEGRNQEQEADAIEAEYRGLFESD